MLDRDGRLYRVFKGVEGRQPLCFDARDLALVEEDPRAFGTTVDRDPPKFFLFERSAAIRTSPSHAAYYAAQRRGLRILCFRHGDEEGSPRRVSNYRVESVRKRLCLLGRGP